MIDFNTLLNAAFDAAIDAKLAPLRDEIKALATQGINTHITRVREDGELELVDDIKKLVDARVDAGIESHCSDFDHADFADKNDLRSEVDDLLDDMFQSKFEAALDGTRVTLNT